ncbi:hypothetical protein Tco_1485325, partial [Tanacetum coccineum]
NMSLRRQPLSSADVERRIAEMADMHFCQERNEIRDDENEARITAQPAAPTPERESLGHPSYRCPLI